MTENDKKYKENFYMKYWLHPSSKGIKEMEMPGIEPGAFHMQSERSSTEPHPLWFKIHYRSNIMLLSALNIELSCQIMCFFFLLI